MKATGGLLSLGLKFESCGCSYDSHWRLTWSLTSGPVKLVKIHASWSEYPRYKLKKKHRMKLCREIKDLETRSEEIESYSTTRQTASTIFFNNPSKVSAKRRLRLRKFI